VPPRPQTQHHRQEILFAARVQLRQRFADPSLDLADLATAVGTSPRQLQRVFSDAETDFRGELLAVRMRAATRLLRSGVPVRRVAGRVGYAGASGLVAAYKRYTGVPPSAAHPEPLDYDEHWRAAERTTSLAKTGKN
jgi:AraC-like DNA-binding protein